METTDRAPQSHDADHVQDRELFPSQSPEDYPMAADSTGDGDPDWYKQYSLKRQLANEKGKDENQFWLNSIH